MNRIQIIVVYFFVVVYFYTVTCSTFTANFLLSYMAMLTCMWSRLFLYDFVLTKECLPQTVVYHDEACIVIVPTSITTVLACGGVLRATNDLQYFHTPNYPSNYPIDKDCEWEIISPIGHSVSLTFEDFRVEYHPSCSFDRVELSEQIINSQHNIATICGSQGLKKTYRTSGSKMFVKFISDESDSAKGFNASYKGSMYSLYKYLIVILI